ncbi:MAG: hypothetical protein FWG77_04960 [Treponema sp.]|nr:hypothetical protein [Treponema sp.]
MPFIQYENIKIQRRGLIQINQINEIIAEYEAAGYSLTLRQIYYQLVSREVIENSEKSYNNIGRLVSNGRLTGLIDWNAIEDRHREHRALPHWETPAEIVQGAAHQYRRDLWEGQDRYCEVWVEKDALIGIVEQAAGRLDCSCFSCKGYASNSSLWAAANRFTEKAEQGRECIIFYLGDHDPSGTDIDRMIIERMGTFGATVTVNRIALTMSQIKKYKLPPYPAKEKDKRFEKYKAKHGTRSWELDALKPEILDALITNAIEMNLDQKLYDQAIEKQEQERKRILDLLPVIEDIP